MSRIASTRENLHDIVADQIRDKIISQRYPAGFKLPNEFELAEEYNVCRYTIREAIRKLSATGLVSVVRGRGTFVNEAALSSYMSPIMDNLILGSKDIRDVFDVRIGIEQIAASRAAINATDEVAVLEKNLATMREKLEMGDIEGYINDDLEFHKTIAIASRNVVLKELVVTLQNMIHYTMKQADLGIEKHQRSLQGHMDIFEAIRNKDGEAAGMAMANHLIHCRDYFA